MFNPLDQPALKQIVLIQLGELASRAQNAGVTLTWTDEVVELLADKAHKTAEGARPAIRTIDTLIGEPLQRTLLADSLGRDRSYPLPCATVRSCWKRTAPGPLIGSLTGRPASGQVLCWRTYSKTSIFPLPSGGSMT